MKNRGHFHVFSYGKVRNLRYAIKTLSNGKKWFYWRIPRCPNSAMVHSPLPKLSAMKFATRLALALLCAGTVSTHAQDGTLLVISQTGTFDATMGTNITSLSTPVLNGSGKVAFGVFGGTNQVIYLANGATLTKIVSDVAGDFVSFSNLALNESGMVAYYAQKTATTDGIYTNGGTIVSSATMQNSVSAYPGGIALSDTGIVVLPKYDLSANGTVTLTGLYDGASSSLTTLATTAQTAPIVGGNYGTFSTPVVNGVGVVAFQVVNNANSQQAIYTTHGSTVVNIAATSKVAPELGANFTSFSTKPALNDSGTVAFTGFTGTGPIASAPQGVFTGSGGALTAIATTARTAPIIGGNFVVFSDPAINNAGLVAFRGRNASFAYGIYTGTGGALNTIATTTQAAPHLTGNFTSFEAPAINSGGTVAFVGRADTSTNKGIYLGDGTELITAAYVGQSVGGSTISSLNFVGGSDRGGMSQFNDNGQVTYTANLANGKSTVQLFTPTLHYRSTSSGTWGTRGNWTVGIQPASVHDVIIDPITSLAVTGPMAPVNVKSLTLNGAAGTTATLALQNTGALTATNGVTNGARGALTGSGKINGNLSSEGLIAPGTASTTGGLSVYGNVTLQNTSTLSLDISGLVKKSGYDFLNVSGTLTLGGALRVSLLNGFAPQAGQSFDLFDAGSVTGAFADNLISLPTLTGGLIWNTSLLAAQGIISVNPGGPVISTWAPGATGSWSAAGNWTGGVPNGVGASATFASTNGSPTSVSVNGAKTVGSIAFSSAGGFSVSGGAADTVTMDNGSSPATIGATAGTNTISAPLNLQSSTQVTAASGSTVTLTGNISGIQTLTTSGLGTVNLDGQQNYAALNANAGTTNVDGSFSSGAVTAGANAHLNFTTSQTLNSLTVGAGGIVRLTATGGGSTVTAVPEPGAVALLAAWSALILWRTRRFRQAR
jgi:hypothetical protein